MSETARTDIKIGRKTVGETGATLLVAGGLVSAFGAASCCALPVLLGSLGLAGAWLGNLSLIAGPHRAALLLIAVIGLVGGGVLMRRRRAAACAPGSVCARPLPSALVVVALSLGAVLTVLGFVFA
jgi:mercuric ion transport protein